MISRLDNLRRRRELLVAQAAAQRDELPIPRQQLQQHLRLVDMGFAAVRFMRQHPALTIASSTLLLPTGRNKLVLWSSRLFTVWEVITLVRKQWRNSR